MITVLAIAMDSLAQQLVQYEQTRQFVEDKLNGTTVSRAVRYSVGTEARTDIINVISRPLREFRLSPN